MKSKSWLLQGILFGASLFLLSGCREIYRYARSGEVVWALKKELRDKHSGEVDMAKLIEFKWDGFLLLILMHPQFMSANG